MSEKSEKTTVDPDVVIEEDVVLAQLVDPVSGKPGARSITYRSLSTGKRWRVLGNCDRRGNCLIGTTISGVEIRTLEDLEDPRVVEAEKIRELDVPVTPRFRGCCPFIFAELD